MSNSIKLEMQLSNVLKPLQPQLTWLGVKSVGESLHGLQTCLPTEVHPAVFRFVLSANAVAGWWSSNLFRSTDCPAEALLPEASGRKGTGYYGSHRNKIHKRN